MSLFIQRDNSLEFLVEQFENGILKELDVTTYFSKNYAAAFFSFMKCIINTQNEEIPTNPCFLGDFN